MSGRCGRCGCCGCARVARQRRARAEIDRSRALGAQLGSF